MKYRLFTLFLVSFISVNSFSQIRKIPAEVTEAFGNLYPHAEKVEWRDALSYFEAKFMLNDYEITADFNSDGNLLKSEKKITFESLPALIKDGYRKSRFSDWQIISVHEVNKNVEGLQYRILVKKSAIQKKYLFFDTNGKMLRESLTL